MDPCRNPITYFSPVIDPHCTAETQLLSAVLNFEAIQFDYVFASIHQLRKKNFICICAMNVDLSIYGYQKEIKIVIDLTDPVMDKY
jgi:hypothetical protein